MHFRHTALALTVLVACSPFGAGLAELPPPGVPLGDAVAETSEPFDLPDINASEPREPREPREPGASEPSSARTALEPLDVPYDRLFQKSVHNAYARSEPLLDQLIYHRVRSVELDIHTSRAGMHVPAGDWFVYHEDLPLSRDSSCTRLSDCLGQLAAFHRSAPRHEVVTLFVDLKDDFERGHRPSDLDAEIEAALGKDAIVRPSDLLASCPGATTLRAAVSGGCHFPTLASLRGKFLVAVTGGSSCNTKSLVSQYGGSAPPSRLAFLAPDLNDACPVEQYDTRPGVVFLNMPLRERARVAAVRTRGLVARVYGNGLTGVDSAVDFAAARLAGATHVATNRVSFEEDAWSTGERTTASRHEGGSLLGVTAESGEPWSGTDGGFYAYEREALTPASETTWSTLVSVPSSHVDPGAKACLVARASEQANVASVAVCRPFDDGPPRAEIRRTDGGPTETFELGDLSGLTPESPAFLRLSLKSVTGGTDVAALASADGTHWVPLARVHLAAALPLQGVRVSSHGRRRVKALFANLARRRGSGEDATPARMDTRTLRSRALGESKGAIFDGAFPRTDW
jgi:hypothetical protein